MKAKTVKGAHYFFRHTDQYNTTGIYNCDCPFRSSSVNMKTCCAHSNGVGCVHAEVNSCMGTGDATSHTKEGALISIYPSQNKQWVRCILDTPVLPLPDTFVEMYTE